MEQRAKRAAPKYEDLKGLKGWPDLDTPDAFLYFCAEALTADGDPVPGSVEAKAALILTKLAKWGRRQASALHHLAAILTQIQRPGSHEAKRRLAELIEERVEDYRRLEDAVLSAIGEAGGVD